MGTMESTLYLPDEVLSLRNYPEVSSVTATVQEIMVYMAKVDSALVAYTSSTMDRIDLSITDLQKYVGLCRSVCTILGTSRNVCYDLLMEIREFQDILQDLAFIKTRYSSQYIGTPTSGG